MKDENAVWSVTFSPDSKLYATASGDDPVSMAVMPRQINQITSVRMRKRSEKSIKYGLVKIFDTVTNQVRLSISHDAPTWAVVFVPDGTACVTGSGSSSQENSRLLQWFNSGTG